VDKNRLPRKGYIKLAGQDAKEIKLFDFIPLLKWLRELDEARHYELLLVSQYSDLRDK
jgi:hypothetical protein